ncbi:MAG: hypothetical protein JEY96_10200 [Bacteroidales bacterium]|nr:hypothetical protein [Bacteroidales bacterium]
MKKILFLSVLVVSSFVAKSQDIIKTMYGDDINAKVAEITKEEIKYTKASDSELVNYSIRIVKVEKIIFEDGTVKIFGGTLDLEEDEAEVLFKKKEKPEELESVEETQKNEEAEIASIIEKELQIEKEVNDSEFSGIFPSNVGSIAGKGAKVFLQSKDNNAAIHARNYINKWDFWEVTPDLNNADLVIKLDVRFQGPMYYFVKANFINPKNQQILHSTQEFKPERGNKDPNHKRAAVKHFVDKVLIPNFR